MSLLCCQTCHVLGDYGVVIWLIPCGHSAAINISVLKSQEGTINLLSKTKLHLKKKKKAA